MVINHLQTGMILQVVSPSNQEVEVGVSRGQNRWQSLWALRKLGHGCSRKLGLRWTSVGSDMLGCGVVGRRSTKRWSTFFFVGAKNSPQKTTKVMVSFWGNPKQNLGGILKFILKFIFGVFFWHAFFYGRKRNNTAPQNCTSFCFFGHMRWMWQTWFWWATEDTYVLNPDPESSFLRFRKVLFYP